MLYLFERLLLQKATESGSSSSGGCPPEDEDQSEVLKGLAGKARQGWDPQNPDIEARPEEADKKSSFGKLVTGLFMSHFAYDLKSSGLTQTYDKVDWAQHILDSVSAHKRITGWANTGVHVEAISVAQTARGLIGLNIISIDQLMPLPPGYGFTMDDAKKALEYSNRFWDEKPNQGQIEREWERTATSFVPSKTAVSSLFDDRHYPFSKKFFYPRTENRRAALSKHFYLDGPYPPTVWFFHEEGAPQVERANLYAYAPPKQKAPVSQITSESTEKEVFQAGYEALEEYRNPPNNLSYPPELVIPVFKVVTPQYGCPDSKFLTTVKYVKPLYGVTFPLRTVPGNGSIPNLPKKTVELLNNPLHFKTRWASWYGDSIHLQKYSPNLKKKD